MSAIVRKRFDRVQEQPVSEADLEEIERASRKDVDCSDIPEWTEAAWQAAVPNPLTAPRQPLVLHVGADMLAWLSESQGAVAEERAHELLREAMMKDIAHRQRKVA